MSATTTTTFISVVHRWNALLCPPIGLVANLLLILLVLTKTPKEMRLHSRILLQTGILDILLLLVTTFGQPALSYQQNTMLLIFEGYFIDCFTNDIPLRIFSFVWLGLNLFDIYGLTVQFIYRYLVLNRGVKINLCQYLLMLSALFFIILSIYLFNYFQQIPDINSSSNEQLVSAIYGNGSTKYVSISHEKKWYRDVYTAFFMLFYFTSFGIIAFCGWKISRHVNSQMTAKKKKMSNQLNRTLIILAILPFICLILINVVVVPNILTKNDKEGNQENQEGLRIASISLSLLVHWLPVLNPIITMLTNKPYRKALFKAVTMATNRIFPK